MPVFVVRVTQRFAMLFSVICLLFTSEAAAIQCYECHGSKNPPDYRPVDSPNRDIYSGGFQGSHRKHMDSTATPSTCIICHPGSDSYGPGHRNGLISVSMDWSYPAAYRNGSTSFLQRPNPSLGSCTNVTCHSDGTYVATGVLAAPKTPVWGSTGQSCTACHGNPPAYDSGLPKANSHLKHKNSCSNCHYGTTTDGSAIAANGLHRNGAYDISAQDGSVKYNRSERRCSSNYCHSNGISVVTGSAFANLSTPAWGSTRALECGSCHGNPPAYGSGTPKANAHLKHNFYGYSCSRCHYATTKDGLSIAGESIAHANRGYDVSVPPGETIGYSYSATGGSCSASYCHSTGQGTSDPTQPPEYRTVSWSQQFRVNCHSCHWAGYHSDNFIPYMASGNHKKHLDFDGGRGCTTCHYQPHYENKSCDQCHLNYYGIHTDSSARGPEHANGVIDVNIDPNMPVPGATGSYSGDPAPRTPYGNCSNLYCHSQGTRQLPPFDPPNVADLKWGGASLPADCTGCHGGDSLSSIPINTGSHTKHGAAGCAVCHNITASANRNAIPVSPIPRYSIHTNKSYHSNGYVNVSIDSVTGGRYGTDTTYWDKLPGTGKLRCTNVYCHSSGVKVVTGNIFGNISTPVWGGSSTCSSCHGYPPAYPDTLPKANAHQTHSTKPCSSCHYNVTTDGVSIANRALHANSSYELAAGPGVGFSYTFSMLGGSCANVSCHPGGSIPRAWTSSACGNCHGAPPSDSAHKKHFTGLPRMAVYGNTSSTARYLNNCGVCHPLDTARDNDGSVQVELFNPLAPASSLKARSTAAGYSAGTCTNVYCHSDGSTVATAQSPASPPVAWSAPTLSCGSCHGNPPAYQSGSPKANSHARHDGYSCSICHATTTADGTTIADQSRHVSGAYDLAPGANTTFAYSFAQAGGSCSANSCHSDGTYPRSGQVSGSVTIQWGGAAPSCSGCHGNPPLHQSAETRLNSHQSHTKYSCSACHYLVTSNGSSITNRALHANGAYDLAPSPTVAFTAQRYVYSYLGNYTITCNNSSCHNDGTATATGTPVLSQAWTTWGYVGLNCGSCHGNPPAYATGVPKKNSHSRHTSYGCQACHYSVTTDGTTIADRVLHVNNSYEVTPSPGNTFIYIFATTGGSCSGVSCHNDGTGVATGTKVNANPSVWGAAFSCASCHGNPPAYANGSPKKNSHLGSHAGIGCQLCHAAVTTTGYSITTPALHNNNQYNVTAGTGTAFTYTYSATGGTCTNISCHSDGTSIHTGTTRSNSVAWGVATLGCSGCHGNPPAYPNYSPKGNDHNRAGHASLGCQVCHYTVTSNGTGITDQSRHKNGVYDVSAGPTTFFIYSSYPGWYGRCRNVTCHGDGTAVATGIQQSTGSSLWVNITDCSYCHTAPPAYISGTPKKNSHTKHWQSIYYCRECHYSVMNTTSNSTVTTPANHKNGQYNVSSAPGRTMTYLYSPTGGSCSATTCHSDGTSVATGTLRGATTVAWGGVPMTCSSCHAYPPLYPTGSPKKNSHAKHQGYGCQECHGQTTYNGTTVNGYYHINGQYSLYGQRIGTYTYNANGGNCSNVKCHSDGTYVATGTNSNVMGALTWGANLTLTCTACHSMPPAYTNGYPKGNSHGLHSALSIGCRACHASVTANGSSILDRSKHANGSYDVAFVNSTTSFTYTYRNNGSSCGDVACHPAGKKNINWSIYAQAPVTFSPINNENYAPVDLPVKVVFTDDIDPATITAEGVFTLTNDLIPVAGTVSYDVATKTASFNPSVPLDYSNPYTARLANTVKNLAGQPLQNSYAWSFTTTNSPNFTYLVNSNFDQFSLGYLNTNSPSGGGYWNVITPGWNGSSLSSMNQGYAKVDEATKIDAQLDTQVFDLSAYQSLKLGFTYNFKMSPPSVADVDISFNGSAGPWTNIWKRTAPYANYSYQGSDTLNLSTMAKGQPNVKIRFRFTPQTSSNTGWWALDNVYVGADPR